MHEPVLTLIKETLADGREISIKVCGNCMKPVIRSGAVVTLKQMQSFSNGDIVAYHIGSNVKVHRIIAKTENTFFIKADSNNPDMHPVGKENLLGKVVSIKNPAAVKRVLGKLRSIIYR